MHNEGKIVKENDFHKNKQTFSMNFFFLSRRMVCKSWQITIQSVKWWMYWREWCVRKCGKITWVNMFHFCIYENSRDEMNIEKTTMFFVNHCIVYVPFILIYIDWRWLWRKRIMRWNGVEKKLKNEREREHQSQKVVHWIISPLEIQIKPEQVKEGEWKKKHVKE